MDQDWRFKVIKLHVSPVFDHRFINNKIIKTYGDNVYTNFPSLNALEDSIEYESFTVISIPLFVVYGNKCYLQVYLNNCAYKIVNT